MKFENITVYNMFEAIQAMRLSYNSSGDTICTYRGYVPQKLIVGPRDEKLIRKLVAAGPSHRKFMRQILLSVDITAPRYWWMQFDTYKVGVTSCSESTMHTLMERELTIDDFDFYGDDAYYETLVQYLEMIRGLGQFEKLVRLLPQGYKQKRHVTMNYEVMRTIREQRFGHKLTDWSKFIEWSDTLPYASLFFEKALSGTEGNKCRENCDSDDCSNCD